jgi:hypothetical protein
MKSAALFLRFKGIGERRQRFRASASMSADSLDDMFMRIREHKPIHH